jgi:hypothetical protein
MNRHNRALAGSSRADHAVIESAVITALKSNCNKSFSQLVRELIPPINQSVLAAALSSLLSDGLLTRISNGNFILTARCLDILDACRRRDARQARRAA